MAELDFQMRYTQSGSAHLPVCLCGTCMVIDWIEEPGAFGFPLGISPEPSWAAYALLLIAC